MLQWTGTVGGDPGETPEQLARSSLKTSTLVAVTVAAGQRVHLQGHL